MKICSDQEVKMFCKDYVEKAEIMFILASVACVLIILSLVSGVIIFSLKIYVRWFELKILKCQIS